MAKTTYTPDRKGLREIGKSAAMSNAMVDATRPGQRWAEDNAPVDSGEYRDSFEVVPAEVDVAGEARAGAKLVNTSGHALAVEGRDRIMQQAVNQIEGP